MDTDVIVLKQQAISTESALFIIYLRDQFHSKMVHEQQKQLKLHFKKWPGYLRAKCFHKQSKARHDNIYWVTIPIKYEYNFVVLCFVLATLSFLAN